VLEGQDTRDEYVGAIILANYRRITRGVSDFVGAVVAIIHGANPVLPSPIRMGRTVEPVAMRRLGRFE
jgi:hypothetical protein